MKIPVFVSCPSSLNPAQQTVRELVLLELDRWGLEPRTIGVSDYAIDAPLNEVLVLAKHCAGGIILGFEQTRVHSGTRRSGTKAESNVSDISEPSPWNQIEASILFALRLPLLLLKEADVSGGVFDLGASGLFVQSFASSEPSSAEAVIVPQIERWHSRVRERYYRS